MMNLSATTLKTLYLAEKKSVCEISKFLNCSENRINYWIHKFRIPKRTVSEAIYIKNNPNGDPFRIKSRLTKREAILYGLGLGLFWGEGHRKNNVSTRLGNTDPELIKKFIDFLVEICGVKRRDIDFSLLIFSDISPSEAKSFWIRELKIKPSQVRGKITVIRSGKLGTYRQKSKYGVLILQYHNTKLRRIIGDMLESLKKMPM